MSAHAGGMCVNQFKNCLTPLFSFSSPARKKRMQASLLSHALRREVPLRSNCRKSLPLCKDFSRCKNVPGHVLQAKDDRREVAEQSEAGVVPDHVSL